MAPVMGSAPSGGSGVAGHRAAGAAVVAVAVEGAVVPSVGAGPNYAQMEHGPLCRHAERQDELIAELKRDLKNARKSRNKVMARAEHLAHLERTWRTYTTCDSLGEACFAPPPALRLPRVLPLCRTASPHACRPKIERASSPHPPRTAPKRRGI